MNLLTIGTIAAGLYFLSQPKKSAQSASSGKGIIITCNSIKITNKELFQKSFREIVDSLIHEFKITKDSLFSLDIVTISKKLFNTLNPSCSTDPSKMSNDSKMIYLILATTFLKEIRKLIAINVLDPNFKYEEYGGELIGYDCPEFKDKDDNFMKYCKYYFDPSNPLYQKWENVEDMYKDQIANYLKILTDEITLKEINKKLSETLQYP